MRRIIVIVATSIAMFAAGALIAFALGSNLLPDDEPAAAGTELPSFGESEPIIVPIPVEGEPWVEGLGLAQELALSREAASDLGVVLESSETRFQPIATPVTEDDSGSEEPSEILQPVEPGPDSDSEGDAEGRAVDECSGDDAPESCPEGMRGVVLAIRELPALWGHFTEETYPPGTAPNIGSPECALEEAGPGAASMALTANRPVDVTITYHPEVPGYNWDYAPGQTFELSTTPEQAALWQTWVDDPIAGYDDPRYVIDHCFTMTGIEPGVYTAEARLRDQSDPSISVTALGRVRFEVTDAEGEVPGPTKRPTVITASGLGRLYIQATRQTDQLLLVRAITNTGGIATCDTGGNVESLFERRPGTRDAEVIWDTPISSEVLESPEWPYLDAFDHSVGLLVDLLPGTDYLVCLYWLDQSGPSFDANSVELAEQVAVTTPPAYRPVIDVEGLTNLFGGANRAVVLLDHPDCLAPIDHEWDGPFRTERRINAQSCELLADLTGVDRDGVTVITTVVDGGVAYHARTNLRLSLGCPSTPCPIRSTEVALVPLPLVPAEERLCGSGFGGGCGGEVPMRSAGDAVLAITYLPIERGSSADWVIGEVGNFTDTPRPLGETPLLSVTSQPVWPLNAGSEGIAANVTVDADRPVTLQIDIGGYLGEPPCFVGEGPAPYRSDVVAGVHLVTLRGLCVGEAYLLTITGEDAEGAPAAVFAQSSLPLSNLHLLVLPKTDGRVVATLEVTVPQDGRPYTVSDVWVGAINDFGPPGMDGSFWLGWFTTPAERERLEDDGWRLISSTVDSCSAVVNPEPFRLSGRGRAQLGQERIELVGRVQVHANHGLVGGEARWCDPAELVEDFEFHTTVDLADLIAGVEITSPSGNIVLTLRLATVR